MTAMIPSFPVRLALALSVLSGLALAPAARADTLLIERDVTVLDMLSDRFTWLDVSGRLRVAVLAHNDGQVGPGGTRGGELREYRYETPGGTRIVRASGSGASGFGYVVGHRSEGTTGIAGDDSPLGHFFPGQFERVFEGANHAIFRFTLLYPRHARTGADDPNVRYDVPITIEWVIASGRDHPLWAITWDLSDVPENAVESDSRAPYGELLFDGAGSEGAHSVIAGVGWGDRFRFESTTSPVTYNSAWTWNVDNTIPHVRLWTTDVDATMGTVKTQTIQQHDAGGYFGADRWGTTSADGDACGAQHVMPCDFNWPYQSINYSLNSGAPDNATNNTRLAWGTNFGFIGQSAFLIHGSAFFGGPLPDTTAVGWPRQSYSTYVVLGLHSDDPVGRQVTEVETVQGTVLTADTGSVVTSGPAGVARSDAVTYDPPGWNHVYGAWALRASGNRIDANLAIGAGSLENPLVIVSNWTGGLPGSVRLDGSALVADTDYFASLRADAQELWITVNRILAGATNRLEIGGAAAPPPSLSLVLGLNQAAFGPGDELVLTATLTPGSAPPLVDAYVVVRLPDGTLLSLTLDGALVPGIVPIASGLTAVPFSGELLRYVFSGTEPEGDYTWLYALTEAGTANILVGISERPFTRTP